VATRKKTKQPRKGPQTRPAAAVAEETAFPRLIILAICEGMSHDPIAKKFSLYGLFGALNVSSLPTPMRPIAFYTRLKGNGQRSVSVSIKGPDEVPLGDPVTVNVDFGLQPNVEIAGYLGGLPIKQAGVHRIEVLVDGQRVGEPLELEVNLLQPVVQNA